MTESTALVPAAAVAAELATREDAIKALLEGTGLSTMAFRQDVLMALARAPKLQAAACTAQGVLSLVTAAQDAAQLGLRLGSGLGLCALVPYRNEIKLLVQYQGKIELSLGTGLVRSVAKGFARERDEFSFDEGSEPFVKHHRALSGDRGAIIAGYAIATMVSGEKIVQIIDRTEAMAARAKSAGYAWACKDNPKAPDHAWHTSEGEMWAKTAVHRLWKVLPKLPKVRELAATGRVMVDVEAEEVPDDDMVSITVDAEIIDETPAAPPAPAPAPPARRPAKSATAPPPEPAPVWAMTAEMWAMLTADAEAGGFKLPALADELGVGPLPAKGSQVTQAQYEALRSYIDGEELPF